jgi:hypothetical protein
MQLDQAAVRDPCEQAWADNYGLIWTAGILLRIRCSGADRDLVAVRAGQAAALRVTISWPTIHTAARFRK